MVSLKQKNDVIQEKSPVKVKKCMGFGLILVSLFFLYNPDINVIDLFPDFIGYILMTMGLSQLSMMNEYISDASARFKKMILVSACKFASIIFIFGMSDAANRPYTYLLFAFSFAVIDLIFLIPAYRDLFSGLLDLADRYESKVIYETKRPGSKSRGERMRNLTLAFVVMKSVSSTWPEFLSLVTSEYTDSFVMYMYDYIGAFRIISVIIALVLCIPWLIKMIQFLAKICREKIFIENLKEAFNTSILPKKGIFIRRTLNTVLTMLTVAAIFCIDFSLGSVGIVGDSAAEINIIPDAIAATIIFASAYMLRSYVRDSVKTRAASLAYLVISLTASIMKIIFIAKYDYYTAVNKLDEAYSFFRGMIVVTLIENIVFVITVVMLVLMLKEVIVRYTGYVEYAGAEKSERVTTLQKELTGKLIYIVIFAIIGAVTAVMYEWMLPEKYVLAQYMWLVDFIAQSIFAIFTLRSIFAIKDEVENRFMLE